MQLVVNATSTDGNPSDKIEEGILKIAESKAIGMLSLKSVIILSKCRSLSAISSFKLAEAPATSLESTQTRRHVAGKSRSDM